MPKTYSIDDGRFLVRLARNAITGYLSNRKTIDPPTDTPKHLLEKSGVFVTLNSVGPVRRLRGCIGYPLPTEPLVLATIHAAIEAATGDPRFEPVQLSEFTKDITVEISVLTVPEELVGKKPAERPKEIEIGRDGLVVGRGPYHGLLLPQVAPEWDWNTEEFLSQCCLKAGLPPDAWLDAKTKVEKFQAVVFEQNEPNGEVHPKKL